MTDHRSGVESFVLSDDGTFPNNRLPVMLYRRAVAHEGHDPAASFEETFRGNGWEGLWRNGIFDFPHYHAATHEVLGCARGRVRVQLGGPNGREIEFHAGDVVVLPAGTAHMNLGHSDDYLIVGGYPAGQSPDMCYGKPGERPGADREIAAVPLPETDPVHGEGGRLLELWHL
jgi:uncharacterized protein YjlB